MTKLSPGDIATIVGAAPRIGDIPRDTPLALWWRIKGRLPDPFESQKRVSRAIEVGLLGLLVNGGQAGEGDHGYLVVGTPVVVKACLWYTADQLAQDGPPPYLLACVQRRLALERLQEARVGVLLAGGIWKTWGMRAIPEFQQALADAERAFVVSLERDEPPAASDEGDLEIVAKLWPKSDGPRIILPPAALKTWERIKQLRSQARKLSAERKLLEARLRQSMGASGEAVIGARRLVLRTVKTPTGTGRKLVEL